MTATATTNTTGNSAGMIISRKRGLRHDIDAGAVIGLVLAAQNARLRGQLPAHFTHDSAGRLADRVHAERGENERQQAANKETDDDLRIVERELEIESVPACA